MSAGDFTATPEAIKARALKAQLDALTDTLKAKGQITQAEADSIKNKKV